MAKVAIGLPAYNSERYLPETLDSLLSQTMGDFEIAISDNHSSDRTQEICLEYAERDSRIRYCRQPENIGIFRNYDYVLDMIDCEYFKWASSNDTCDPTFLERCVAVLDEQPDCVLSYPRTVLVDEGGCQIEKRSSSIDLTDNDPVKRYRTVLEHMSLNNMMNGVFRTAKLRSTSLNRVYLASDINMIAELTLFGKIVQVPEYLFHRRASGDAMTGRNRFAFPDEPRDVLRRPNWDFLRNQLQGVASLDVPLGVKVRLLPYLAYRLWAIKRKLTNELFA